tara:strand:- start:339 stop:620 length:282 start_codon:yes stop_codon:yes gene_type:complete
MAKFRKLTPSILRSIILEEKEKLMNESDPLVQGVEDPAKVSAEEKDADEQAQTLEKDIDFIKVLKIEERKTRKYLKKVQEAKARIAKRLLTKI